MNGRHLVSALLCTALAACGSSSGAPGTSSATTALTATPAIPSGGTPGVVPTSLTQVQVSGGSGSASQTPVSLNFTDSTYKHIQITLTDQNGLPVTALGQFDWDSSRNAYVNSSTGGTLSLYFSPNATDVFTARLSYTDPGSSASVVGYSSLSTNNTALANLPTSGSATYSGIVEATDNKANVVGGTIDLSVTFAATGNVNGTISIDKGTVFGATSFGILPTQLADLGTGGQSVAGFYGSLSGTNVASSYVDGTFTGSSNATTAPPSVGGVFYVEGTPGSLAGAYSAAKQ